MKVYIVFSQHDREGNGLVDRVFATEALATAHIVQKLNQMEEEFEDAKILVTPDNWRQVQSDRHDGPGEMGIETHEVIGNGAGV